jgi:hypothetical protein
LQRAHVLDEAHGRLVFFLNRPFGIPILALLVSIIHLQTMPIVPIISVVSSASLREANGSFGGKGAIADDTTEVGTKALSDFWALTAYGWQREYSAIQ